MNTNRGGGLTAMNTSSSYVQRSQGRYDTIEQSASFSSNSRNNYATVDASRVRANGDGLLRAYRNEKASFTVDTRDGGMSILFLIVYR
jgi:hypothetical protein